MGNKLEECTSRAYEWAKPRQSQFGGKRSCVCFANRAEAQIGIVEGDPGWRRRGGLCVRLLYLYLYSTVSQPNYSTLNSTGHAVTIHSLGLGELAMHWTRRQNVLNLNWPRYGKNKSKLLPYNSIPIQGLHISTLRCLNCMFNALAGSKFKVYLQVCMY